MAFLVVNSAGWCYGPPIEDFGCITLYAQSTAARLFAVAVKSDVVHLVVVCAGRSSCSLSKLNRLFTLGGQEKYLLMPA